jgi:hypothetical protein
MLAGLAIVSGLAKRKKSKQSAQLVYTVGKNYLFIGIETAVRRSFSNGDLRSAYRTCEQVARENLAPLLKSRHSERVYLLLPTDATPSRR